MNKTSGSITVVLAVVGMLSGCGPSSNGPAPVAGNAQSSQSSTQTAQTPTVAPSSAAVSSAPPTTRPISPTPMPLVADTALAAVAGLTVKGRAPKTGYIRSHFGQTWFDTNRNGCDTRNDILRRDLAGRQMKNPCKVLAGTLAPDPYTGAFIPLVYAGVSQIDIDHVVALSDAWQKGAATWPAGRRLALANDPLNLLAVDASANRSKGDGDTATWLPPNKGLPLRLRRETGRSEGQVRPMGHRGRAGRHAPRLGYLPFHAPAGARFRANGGGAALHCQPACTAVRARTAARSPAQPGQDVYYAQLVRRRSTDHARRTWLRQQARP